jgi:hypothetical protein
MKPTEYRDSHREARQRLSGLSIVKQASVSAAFPYGYLMRLLDDRELNSIQDVRVRSETRAVHRQVYRKSLQLLRRDVGRMLVNRRKLMETRQEWRFEALVGDTVRVWKLLWTLRVAGAAHGIHVPVMVNAAREACRELQSLMAAPLTSSPAVRAL